MPVAGGQAIIELPGKVKELCLGEAKALPDGLQHGIHNQLHGMGEGGVGQLVHHQQEQFTNGPVILITALLQGEEHVPDKTSATWAFSAS